MPLDYLHLDPADYPLVFPAAVDAVPEIIQKSTFIDAWIFNRIFVMIQSVQAHIINNA